MKLKQSPDDFRVEELTAVTPGDRGDFAFYRLDKRGWSTPDAISAVRRRWQIDFRRLSYGGLKDKHADTTQYLTIARGPQRNLAHQGVTLTYLGQVERPYASTDIAANRFRVTLRDLSAKHVPAVKAAAEEAGRAGVPNYFDDQRFGSAATDADGRLTFVAREMVLGRFEDALKLALAAPYEFDRAEQKREKAVLLAHWRDWKPCKDALPRGHARSLVDYLVHHPEDFKGAVERLRPELRSLYLSAYQSHLWNRMLALWLEEAVPADRLVRVRLKLGDVPMPRELTAEEHAALSALQLPLPSARLAFDPDAPWAGVVTRVMAGEGFLLEQMKIRGMRQPFFSRGERPAWLQPSGMTAAEAPDESHPRRHKLVLSFDLPRGCYATLLVKRVTASNRSP